MPFPLFNPLLATFQTAFQMGYGEEDAIGIIRFLDKHGAGFKTAVSLNKAISN